MASDEMRQWLYDNIGLSKWAIDSVLELDEAFAHLID